jgi:hypothetical protein
MSLMCRNTKTYTACRYVGGTISGRVEEGRSVEYRVSNDEVGGQ